MSDTRDFMRCRFFEMRPFFLYNNKEIKLKDSKPQEIAGIIQLNQQTISFIFIQREKNQIHLV
jgi:hypothetical protein